MRRGIIVIKKKRAAQGRRSGNHHGRHRILKDFQGTPAIARRRIFYFRFLFAYKNSALCRSVCQEGFGNCRTEGGLRAAHLPASLTSPVSIRLSPPAPFTSAQFTISKSISETMAARYVQNRQREGD